MGSDHGWYRHIGVVESERLDMAGPGLDRVLVSAMATVHSLAVEDSLAVEGDSLAVEGDNHLAEEDNHRGEGDDHLADGGERSRLGAEGA
jgi:hypothetical protein